MRSHATKTLTSLRSFLMAESSSETCRRALFSLHSRSRAKASSALASAAFWAVLACSHMAPQHFDETSIQLHYRLFNMQCRPLQNEANKPPRNCLSAGAMSEMYRCLEHRLKPHLCRLHREWWRGCIRAKGRLLLMRSRCQSVRHMEGCC